MRGTSRSVLFTATKPNCCFFSRVQGLWTKAKSGSSSKCYSLQIHSDVSLWEYIFLRYRNLRFTVLNPFFFLYMPGVGGVSMNNERFQERARVLKRFSNTVLMYRIYCTYLKDGVKQFVESLTGR